MKEKLGSRGNHVVIARARARLCVCVIHSRIRTIYPTVLKFETNCHWTTLNAAFYYLVYKLHKNNMQDAQNHGVG